MVVEGPEVLMTTIGTNAITVDLTEMTINIQTQEAAISKGTVVNSDHLHVTALAPVRARHAIDFLGKTMEKEELAEVVVIIDALTLGPTLTTIIPIRTGMIHNAEESPLHTAAGLTMKGAEATTCTRLIEVAIIVVAVGAAVAEADINTTISTMTRSGSAKVTIITQTIQTIWVEAVPAILIMVALAVRIDTPKSVKPLVDAHLNNKSEVVHPHTQRCLLSPLANTAEMIKTIKLPSRHRQSRKPLRRHKWLLQRIQVRLLS